MSVIDNQKDLVDWYDNQERVLTKDFLATIRWNQIKNHPVDESFIPVLIYFRDVEKFTDIYFQQLAKTPTGRDKVVRQFMEKWRHEEDLHGELMNRFLNEIGYKTTDDWYEEARRNIPFSNRITRSLSSVVANLVGTRFTAVHMTWGAINEMSTLNGYKRLWTLAKHPVLEHILRAIAREEANHSFFYWSLAKLKLQQSKFSQQIARYLVDNFWSPVGQGTKPASDTNYVIKKLFDGEEGINMIDNFVTKRVGLLPGFEEFKKVTERIAQATVPQTTTI